MRYVIAWIKSCLLMLWCKHDWKEHWTFLGYVGEPDSVEFAREFRVDYRYCGNCGMRKPRASKARGRG